MREEKRLSLHDLLFGIFQDVVRGVAEEFIPDDRAVRRLQERRHELSVRIAQALLVVVRELSRDPDLVLVPDSDALGLLRVSAQDLGVTSLDTYAVAWAYDRDDGDQCIPGKGLWFQAVIASDQEIRESGCEVSPEGIRKYFCERGCIGHTAAFVQWLRQNPGRVGRFTTIPEPQACARGAAPEELSVLCADFDGTYRQLYMLMLRPSWSGSWFFIGFRLISPP